MVLSVGFSYYGRKGFCYSFDSKTLGLNLGGGTGGLVTRTGRVLTGTVLSIFLSHYCGSLKPDVGFMVLGFTGSG